MTKHLVFHRVVALVFHREQMDEYIAEQYAKTGIVWTFVKGHYQLEVDHIDFNPDQSLCQIICNSWHLKRILARSNSRPCIIWEIGKKDAQIEYPSVAAAAKAIGCSDTSVFKILNNNTHPKWRGEYI